MKKRAAIELSMNVVVIIIISIVILSFGILLLSKLQAGLVKYKEAVDRQTEDRLKALMLNNNENIAVYPQYINIPRGKYGFVGIGVTNNLAECRSFSVQSADQPEKVLYYKDSSSAPVTVTFGWVFEKPTREGNITTRDLGIIMPTNQKANNIMIEIPKYADPGQYVFTFKVIASCSTGCPPCTSSDYGRALVYVTVP